MERCREHWFHEELCNPNPKQGGSREAFEQRNSARDLYFRKRALPQKNGLNCTSPLQVNSNVKHGGVVGYCDHCSNRRGLGASGANSGCSGTKARPGSASVQSWARAGIQEADPRHRGFSREGGEPSLNPLLEGPHFGSLPNSLGSSLLSQLTQKRPHLTGRFRVRGSKQHRLSLFTGEQLLCAE